MRILITGGAGFIGSNLSKRLLDEGHEVLAVDNLSTSSRSNIASLESNPNFSFFEFDVINPLPDDVRAEVVYHLASPASPNKKSPRSYIAYPIETLLVNSQGTYHLLEFSRKNNAKFLFTSTSEIYGDPEVSPQPESYFGNVNPNGVRSVYDEAKRFGEAMTFAYLRKYDMDVRIVRLFNTYGPQMQKDDGRVVSNFINQALQNQNITIYGDGKQTRSFCYVDDMVDALIKAMMTEGTKGAVMNLGNPDERSIKEIAEKVKEMTGSSSPIVFEDLPEDDPKVRQPDIMVAKKLLGWEPTTSLEDGLSKTIEYFKNRHPDPLPTGEGN